MWNITIETAEPLTEAAAEQLLDRLADYHPAIHRGPFGGLTVTISIEAETIRHAATTGLTLAVQAGIEPRTLEVLTTDDYDMAPAGVGDLLSITEAAELLGVTRQAIMSRIQAGSVPARQVGTAWVIPRAGLLPKGRRRS